MGGVKSAAGVVSMILILDRDHLLISPKIGTWSSADHDDEDPAGKYFLNSWQHFV